MALWISRTNQCVLLFALTFSTLIHCKSLLHLSETQTTSDEGENVLSDLSHEDGFSELDDSEYLGDEADSGVLKSALVQGRVVSSSGEVWDAISPKLRCGGDFMKLQLNGAGVDQVELCRGNSAPVPLDHLPPNCGHTTPTYGGLVYATPYDGCGVAQQGGSHVMQMLWQGNPAVISCPMTSSVESAPTPTTTPTAVHDPTQKPQPPGYPNMFWPYYYPYYHNGKPKLVTTSAPTTTLAVVHEPTQKPQPPGYPYQFWPYYYPHHHHGKPKPVATSAPTTTLAVVHEPTQKPQLPGYPYQFWPYYYSHYHHHHHGKPKQITTAAPTTTSAVVHEPTQKPEPPGYPYQFWPYYYPHYHHGRPKPVTTSAPTTSAVVHEPTQKPQPPGYPYQFWPYYYHPQYPVQPPKPQSPTVPPITTTPPPCTTTAAVECSPSANQPSVELPKYSSMLYEKDPFALQYVDLLEIEPQSIPF